MNVLQLAQEFCGKKTLPVPGAVIGSTDVGVIQLRYLLAEAVRELSEYSWTEQKIEKTFASSGLENQGDVETLFGSDFVTIIPNTMWDLSQDRPIHGPISDNQWTAMKAEEITGPINYWKIVGKQFRIFPALPVGHQVRLMYESKYAVADSGGTPKEAITADTDIFLLPDTLVSRSLDYRWKRQKGEPWEADFNEFLGLLPKKLADRGMPVLALDCPPVNLVPGIWVPAGSWPVT